VSDRAKQQLAEIPGVTAISPAAWTQSPGMVSCAVEGTLGTEINKRLGDEHHSVQRHSKAPSAVRVSRAYVANTDDLHLLTSAVEQIARPLR
jgi:selenocysteine lyase/cysteine desulfurase